MKYLRALSLTQLPLNLFALQPIFSGIAALDDVKGGFHPGELSIICGRPGMGKTAVLLEMTKNICQSSAGAGGVAFYSVEMSKENLLKHINSPASLSNLHIDDRADLNVKDINTNQKLIILDYLQLLRAAGSYRSRSDELGSILLELKNLAVKLQVPVIVSSQLNKSEDMRYCGNGRFGVLPDVRSGASVDSVIILNREGYYDRSNVGTREKMEFHMQIRRNESS